MEQMREDRTPHWQLHGLNTKTVFGLTCGVVSRTPRRVSYGIGHVSTWLAYHLMRQSTAAVVENLRVVFPERSAAELRALARETYHCYARDTIDFIRGLSMSKAQLTVHLSTVRGFDRMLAGGKGALLVAGHFGNWELGGLVLRTIFDFPLTVIGMPETDPDVDRMRRDLRASHEIETLKVRQSADTALRIRRILAANEIVAMLADRPFGRDRVEVQFFGRPTGFLRTPALMGYLTGAPLVPSFLLRQPDGRFSGYASDPIYVSRTGDRDAAVQAAMQAFASVLETEVRKCPTLWYHFYPYWASADR